MTQLVGNTEPKWPGHPAKSRRIPGYVHHKPTGQARVRINGKDYYLGKFGSPESHERV